MGTGKLKLRVPAVTAPTHQSVLAGFWHISVEHPQYKINSFADFVLILLISVLILIV